MNDENLENFLYKQFNEVLDADISEEERQSRFAKLYFNAANSISAIYLVNNEQATKEVLKEQGMKMDINLKSLLKNEWYIYTNIEIWIEFSHTVFNEIKPNYPRYDMLLQVNESIVAIENRMGLNQGPSYVS